MMGYVVHINQLARETRADRLRREHREAVQGRAFLFILCAASTAITITAAVAIPPMAVNTFNHVAQSWTKAYNVPKEVSLVLPVAFRLS